MVLAALCSSGTAVGPTAGHWIPSAPGQCNPTISVDPLTGIPPMRHGLHFLNNGFGGKMPGIEILGTTQCCIRRTWVRR